MQDKTQVWEYKGKEKELIYYDGKYHSTEETPVQYSFLQIKDKVEYKDKTVEAIKVTKEFYKVGTDEVWQICYSWYVPGVGPVKHSGKYKNSSGWSSEGEGAKLIAFSGASSIELGGIILNDTEKETDASSESVEALPGVKTRFKKSRTISREVSYSTKLGLGAEAEAKLGANLALVKGELSGKIKAAVELARGEKLAASETREQEVEIDGNVTPKAKIVWIDVYRTGTIKVTQEGKEYKVPFEFPIGTKLVIRKP